MAAPGVAIIGAALDLGAGRRGVDMGPSAIRYAGLDLRVALRLLRCVFGNPFRPVSLEPACLTSPVVAIAQSMYESRDFSAMPILADALQDAGCEDEGILGHCRSDGPHARGCWVIDRILGKE